MRAKNILIFVAKAPFLALYTSAAAAGTVAVLPITLPLSWYGLYSIREILRASDEGADEEFLGTGGPATIFALSAVMWMVVAPTALLDHPLELWGHALNELRKENRRA